MKRLFEAQQASADNLFNHGRRIFSSPEDFEQKAKAYFDKCKAEERVITLTGLALACGTWRQKMLEYEKKPEYVVVMRLARAECERQAEEIALTARNPGGAIFILKNYGWTDKTEIEHTGRVGPMTLIINGLYGQPGEIPLPEGAIIVQRAALPRLASPQLASKGEDDGNGNGGNGKH